MLKKLPLKNIFIVFTAMLVVPVMAFAMTTAVNPSDDLEEQNSNIKITSDDNGIDGASQASPLITSDGALGPDGVSSATTNLHTKGGLTGPDAVSSATSVSGANGEDDRDGDDDDDEDDDDQDRNAIKDDDDEDDEDDD